MAHSRQMFEACNVKHLSFGLLVVQNVLVILMMRYTRSTTGENDFLPSTAVIMQEATKFFVCIGATLHSDGSLEPVYAVPSELLRTR